MKRQSFWRNPIGSIRELIGSADRYSFRWDDDAAYKVTVTQDAHIGDYAFWDRARKGKVDKLTIAGAFLKPLESKISGWALGQMPKFSSENSNLVEKAGDWWKENHASIMKGAKEALGLGDCYMVFNGDASITVVQPHVVEELVDPKDWSKIIGYRITEVYSHPTQLSSTQTIRDDYYANKRVRTVYQDGAQVSKTTYINPLGMVPVIPIHNNAAGTEVRGRPEGESLLGILQWYNDVVVAGLEGNIRQGRPTPVMEDMTPAQIEFFWDTFGENETYYDSAGEQQVRKIIRFVSDNLLTTAGKFKYAQPGSFAGDTEKLLGLLFYLILQYTEIPEFVWGNAIASSKASAESQMPPFSVFIESKQMAWLEWLKPLMALVVKYLSIFEMGIAEDEKVDITFAPLTTQDGKLTLDAIETGLKHGLLDRETALRLMPLDVDDPKDVLNKVDAELEEERQRLEQERQKRAEEDSGFMDANGNNADQQPEDAEEADPDPTADESLHEIHEDHSNDVMIAFYPDIDVARRLAVEAKKSGLDPGDVTELHLTLAYLGEADKLNRESIEIALRHFARLNPQVVGFISGTGRFMNTHRIDEDAIYASYDSNQIGQFRQSLVDTLKDSGVEIASNHGFTPHITLGYIPEDAPTPNVRIPLMMTSFRRVTLAWGNERVHYDLQPLEVAKAA